MKWFKHESDAQSNIKLQAVIDRYGLAAYGYYWACLELVANQGEQYRIKREKRWEIHLKKILNIEIDEQKKYLSMFARKNLIDKDSLKKGELYIPKLEERCDEYTEKVKRKSRQAPDNVGLEEKRTEEKREEHSISFLQNLPEKFIADILTDYDTSEKAIKEKASDLFLWCKSNGKTKKNYKAFLLTAIRKDFTKKRIYLPPLDLAQEEAIDIKENENIKNQITKIGEIFKAK